MDRRSSGIGASHSHHLNITSVHGPLTSEEQRRNGVGSIQVPNQLLQGDRPITKPIGERDIVSVEVGAPSIPKPYSMTCRATAKPNSPVPEHTLFRLRESITPETIETASRKTRQEMAERVGKIHSQLGWRFKMPANSRQLESRLNGRDGHLMTMAMVRSMIHQIEMMETVVADDITASGQSKEAWKKGLLQRCKLEKMHREVLALAEFYCQFYSEPTRAGGNSPHPDRYDPIRELDELNRKGKLDLPPLVPTLAIPSPPEGPVLSPESLELSKNQQEVKKLRKEKKELGAELQQTRKQLTELMEAEEPLKQKEGEVPESFSERLDQLEKEQAELKDELLDKDRQLRQKQRKSINFNDSLSGVSGLAGTDTRLNELEALNRQLQAQKQVADLKESRDQWVVAHVDLTDKKRQVEKEAKKLEEQLNGIEEVHKQQIAQLQKFEEAQSRAISAEDELVALEGDYQGALAREKDLNKELSDTKKELREKVKALKKQQSEFKVKVRETARRDADRYKSELEVAKIERDTNKREKDTAEHQLSDASNEIISLKEQVQSLQLAHSNGLEESESHETEMRLIREELSKAEEKHRKERAALELEIEKARSSEKLVQTELRSKERELNELQSKLDNTERELKEKIASLEKDLRLKDEDISQRDQELVVERRKVNQLTVTSVRLEDEKGKVESSLEELLSELESARRATRSSKEEVTEYIRQLEEAENKAEKLKSKLEDAKSKEREAREHSAIADETLPKLRETSERYQRKLQLSQKEVARLEDLLTSKEDELAEAKIKENSLSSTILSKDERIHKLEEAEAQFRSEVEKANRRTQEKQDKVSELSLQVDEQTHTVEQLTFRIQKLTPEKELSDSKVLELEETIHRIEQERDEAKQNILEAERSLQRDSDAVEVEKAKWESQLKESKSRVSELESRLSNAEKKRDHFKSESDTHTRERNQVKKELQELQISVESLRSQHALEIERLTRERKEFKLEVETLQHKAEVSSADWEIEKAKIEEAKDQLFGDLKSQHDQLLETKQHLDQQLLESWEEVRKTKLELSQKDSTLEQKEQRIEFINKQLVSVQQELSHLHETTDLSSSELTAKVTQLNKEKSALELQLQREQMGWEVEKETLTSRATKAEEERHKFEEQLTSMRARLEESQAKAQQLDGQFSELTRNYGLLELEIKTVTKERDQTQTNLRIQGEELSLVRGSFEQAEIKLKNLERQLKDEQAGRSIEVTELNRQIGLAEADRDHFKTLSETAEEQRKILDEKVLGLEEQLRNSQIEARRLQGQVEDLNVKHERELQEALNRSSHLEKELTLQERKHQHEASGWEEEKQHLTSSHERIAVDLKGKLEQLQYLKDEVDSKVSLLELEGKKKDLEIQQKSEGLEQRKEEVSSLQTEVENLRAELKVLTDQARQAKTDHALALKEKELANQGLVESLEKEQRDRDQKKKKLEGDISSLESERNRLQSKLAELQTVSVENQTLSSTASELRRDLHRAQEELDKIRQKMKEVDLQSEEVLKAKATMQSLLEAEQFRVSSLTEEKKTLEAAVLDKEKALKIKSSELATANESLQRESDELKQLRLQVVSDNQSDSGNESDTATSTGLSRSESAGSTTFSELISPSSEETFDLTKSSKTEIMPKWTEIGPVVLEIKDENYESLEPGNFAIPGLTLRMRNAWFKVASEQEMMEKQLAVYHFTSLDDLPSKTNYRTRVKSLHEEFLKELDSVDDDYQKAIRPGATSEVPLTDDFKRQIEMIKVLTRGNILMLEKKQDEFQEQVAKLASSLEALKQKKPEAGPEDPEAIVDSELTNMATVLSKNPGDIGTEFYTHAVCAIVKSASERLNESWRKKVATIKEADEGHRALQQYEYSLQRLAPEHLPPRLRVSVPEQGRLFLSKLVEGRKAELESKLDEQLGGAHKELAGNTLEEQMLQDPEICDRLLTLVSSLQEGHEGISKLSGSTVQWMDYSYADASLVGLSEIRDEFGLPATPTMSNVLKTMQKELKRPGSSVLAIAIKQHKENYQTRKIRETRRKKLEQQCSTLLVEEGNLLPKQKLRGVTHDDYFRRQKHPHEAEIACFQSGSPVPLVEVSEHVQEQAGFKCSALAQNPNCLMNSFMNGFSKTAVHKTSMVTGDQYIELSEGARCRPSLVFFSKDGKHWNIQLDGRTWSLDPAFLHNHPNYEIPFQINAEGREKKRDWIPLKSASGQTVILVAQKTPTEQQCFMYELGSNDQLIPVPIRGENPRAELIKANLLSKACFLKAGSPLPARAHSSYPAEVIELESLTKTWLPNVSLQQLDGCYKEVVKEVDSKLLKPPFVCTPCDGRVRSLPVELPVLRKIAQEKSRKPKTGAHQETFHPEQFTGFTVNASFGHVSKAFLQAKRELLDESAHGVTETLEGQQKAFQEQVFKNLSVYSGCELQSSGLHGVPDPVTLKNNRRAVLSNFEKVIVNNRKHCVRTLQLKKALENGLVTYIRNATKDGLKGFSDGELLDHAIRNFERGLAPGGEDVDGFIKRMSQLMLVDIDLEQSSLIGQRLEALQHELEDLDFAAFEQVKEPHEYIRRCQEWNLNMALLASRQSNLNNRISSYENILLDTKNLALLSFERRHHIVLSPDQAEELAVTLEGVSQWAKGHEVAMMSHKGTGYGKSTLLLALTDHASAQLGPDTHRSVIVMAPKTNQAELDKGLREYYARKGQNYCRLNLEASFAQPCELTVAKLVEVENTLLGLPATTPVGSRKSLLEQGRVPVGASINDVQILMHLKQTLLDAERVMPDKQALLTKVDDCLDLLRNSMVFADEFDSAMVPHTEADLISVAQAVQTVIAGLGYDFEVEPRSINLKHSEFLFGCKARHLLSATLGTLYCAALASAASSVEEVRLKARTDPVTTNQRFWHFLSLAEPVFFNSSESEGRKKLLTDVLHKVGPEPQVILFDGAESGEDCKLKAHQMSKTLNQERLAMGGVQKSVIYYDHDKNLQMQYQDDPVYGQGATASTETVSKLRRNGGQSTDGYLSKEQSVGTDMPQGSATVGIFHGLVGQAGGEANENYLVQQLGRLTRDSKDLHKAQRVFMAVDLDAVKDIKGADKEKETFNQALQEMNESLQMKENLFPEGIDKAPSALKKVVEQTVSIPIQNSEEGARGYSASIPQVKEKLRALGTKEWAELGLSPEAFQELVMLKTRQWICKNAWLELVTVDIANREKSHHTLSCERELMQARTNSHLDKVYAQEHRWLNDEGVSLVDGLKVGAQGIPREAVPVVTNTLKAEVKGFLQSVERRVVQPGVDHEDLVEKADAKVMRERLIGYFSRLKREGIKLDGKDMVSETNQKLIAESMVSLKEAHSRIEALYTIVDKLGDRASGKESFKVIINKLEESMIRLRTSSGSEEAMRTEAIIESAYSSMMDAVMKIVVYPSTTDVDATEKKILAVVSQCVNFGPDLKLSLKSNGMGIDRMKRNGLKVPKDAITTKQSCDKFRWKKKGLKGQWNLIGCSKQAIMDCDLAPGHFSIKASYIPNKNALSALQQQSASLQGRQAELDHAVKLCRHPVKKEFKGCVEEVERALMQKFDAFAKEQERITRQEQQLMLKQSELRQSKLYKVLV
ncbi:hypothetical protein [Endozoicomonas numazuensis]|uniref:Uncharacterized protein n=1 Tax=Endozoicomonas numazuensis TaxID=1137799 RepID=A0A081NMU5_9GAMM|nr:hypothetical protein [Endozoicomonas numazuensis]KEQ19768.1 hypothetical protein GZ78_07845 [Endozoicomonas numazuensis]